MQKNDHDNDEVSFTTNPAYFNVQAQVNYYLNLLNHAKNKNYIMVRAELLPHLSNLHHHGKKWAKKVAPLRPWM